LRIQQSSWHLFRQVGARVSWPHVGIQQLLELLEARGLRAPE
jgi:hypothetical protein